MAIFYAIVEVRFVLVFLRSLAGSSFAERKWEELRNTLFSKYLHVPDSGGGISFNPKEMKLEGYSGQMSKSDFSADFVKIARIYAGRFVLTIIIYLILSVSLPSIFYPAFIVLIKDFFSTITM